MQRGSRKKNNVKSISPKGFRSKFNQITLPHRLQHLTFSPCRWSLSQTRTIVFQALPLHSPCHPSIRTAAFPGQTYYPICFCILSTACVPPGELHVALPAFYLPLGLLLPAFAEAVQVHRNRAAINIRYRRSINLVGIYFILLLTVNGSFQTSSSTVDFLPPSPPTHVCMCVCFLVALESSPIAIYGAGSIVR